MSRFRIGFAVMALVAAAVAVPAVLPGGSVAAAPPFAGGDIRSVCAGTPPSGNTFTLTANCGPTDAPITVPDGLTVNGNGHTISATNPPAPGTYTGAVLTNAAGAHTMNIENLTVTGPTAGFSFVLPQNTCSSYFPGLFGIFFNDASGSVRNVHVLNMFQTNTAPGSPACIVGHSIRADGVSAHRTVNITNAQVSNYQRGGMFASGNVTMNVSASTIGPGSSVPFSIAQNAVQWSKCCTQSNNTVAPSGSITGSTIAGTSFVSTHPVDPATASSTAVLLYGANNVTVEHNTITGGSDIGISVSAATTNSTVAFNAINRPHPPTPDSFGVGVNVDATSRISAANNRLECNTFSGWKTNIHGAVQISCSLPAGTCGSAYSAHLTATGGTTPYTWSTSGALPPGLHLATAGTVTGTPTMPGTYPFTAQVSDSGHPPLMASQGLSLTITTGSCAEEVGEDPAVPESSEPGEAPAAPITPGHIHITG
jgi:hypothetical protein